MAVQDIIKLYQFPISHYCEKIRWALDYKCLPYQIINCLPGLHARTTTKLAKHSSVPVLEHNGTAIQGSAKIISYLENEFPDKPLNFSDDKRNKEALEWERFADEHIGPHVRRIMYHDLLNHRDIVIPFFSHKGPWYSSIYFKLTYPKLANVMRKLMKINDEHVSESKEILQSSLSKLNNHLASGDENHQGKTYLVGNQFSRADLAVSALLAPLFSPKEYGLDWPKHYPEDIQSLIDFYAPHLMFAKKCYAENRTAKAN